MSISTDRDHIRTRGGQVLPTTIQDYNAARGEVFEPRTLKAVCYAPFLSMDFDATGAVRLCNHSHSEVATLTKDASVLEIWRGAVYRKYREDFADYVLDEKNCPHCVRQCAAGAGSHVFATEQFDASADDDPAPAYPKRLIFRLHNLCNLACLMCDGQTSSRIRIERDKLPNPPSRYGAQFFRDMEEMLPHVEHVEFYGGEPFLVEDHVKIFDMLRRLGAECTIYVNTNGVSVTKRAREWLEALNFKTIAVSMDAVSDELHGEIRYGLRNSKFLQNMAYFLDLRERRGVDVMLNVTEHRKNWFELPEVFRFAEERKLYLHINTCIHPHNVTLYTLPQDQLRYVLAYFEAQRSRLLSDYPEFSNLTNFDFLISLVRSELESRGPEWEPTIHNRNQATDGWLAAPRPGIAPFADPNTVRAEAQRIVTALDGGIAARMLDEMARRTAALDDSDGWGTVHSELIALRNELPQFDAADGYQ